MSISSYFLLGWLPKHDLLPRKRCLEFKIKSDKIKEKTLSFNIIVISKNCWACRIAACLSLSAEFISLLVKGMTHVCTFF